MFLKILISKPSHFWEELYSLVYTLKNTALGNIISGVEMLILKCSFLFSFSGRYFMFSFWLVIPLLCQAPLTPFFVHLIKKQFITFLLITKSHFVIEILENEQSTSKHQNIFVIPPSRKHHCCHFEMYISRVFSFLLLFSFFPYFFLHIYFGSNFG